MGTVIEIWKARGEILEGIKNNLFKQEHVEEVARDRNLICNSCEYLDKEGAKCAVPGTQPCCGQCGCSLALKLRSLSSSCPVGKWEAVMTSKEEDLLQDKLDQE